MNVLVINCGSSSLKYQLIDSASDKPLASGICERVGIDGWLTRKPLATGGNKIELEITMENHETAVKVVLDALTNQEYGVIRSLNEINAVGHRVVHGGEKFSESVVITDEVEKTIEACNDLAPLHNPANLIGIRACKAVLPNVPMVAVFDTAFHQTMPTKAYLYGIPYSYYEDYKIRRYGFHGTSHSFVSKRLAELADLDIQNSKMIICHIGNGSSITAIQNGKSVDTTMGLTPLEGMIMGTRSGNIDPAILSFIAQKENKSLDEIMDILNKQSGLLGLSRVSSDFRELRKARKEGNELASQAIDAFIYSALKFVGGYIAAMNGVDAIAFTAGIGENGSIFREGVVKNLGYLGITLDETNNKVLGEEIMISTPDSKVKVFVVPTNEELAIARETKALLK